MNRKSGMRTKSRNGGRARLQNLSPKPSASALELIGQAMKSMNEDNSLPSVEADASISNGDVDLVPPAKKSRHLSTNEILQQDNCLELDWKGLCIKCNRVGKVMVCFENGCPISVHQKCMGCPAWFDEMGNFYCPYCLYKHALGKFDKVKKNIMLKEKALSLFLDSQVIDNEPQKETSETTKTKHCNEAMELGNDSESIWKRTDVLDRSMQSEKDPLKEVLAPESPTCNSHCKEAGEPLENKQNVSDTTAGNVDGLSDYANHRKVVEPQTLLETIVVCGGDGECCREEGSIDNSKFIRVSKRLKSENQRNFDEDQPAIVIEDQQEAEVSSVFHVIEEAVSDDSLHVSAQEKLKNEEIIKENEGSRIEVNTNQEVEHQTTVPCKLGEPIVQGNLVAIEEVGNSADSIITAAETVLKKITKLQPSSHGPLRRSPRNISSGINSDLVQNEEITTPRELTRIGKPSLKPGNSPIPTARRNKLLWKEEEEEMLKQEGVQKFAKSRNKNIPWRKILEFGQHVFDATRTPADLKDKWRKILAKNVG